MQLISGVEKVREVADYILLYGGHWVRMDDTMWTVENLEQVTFLFRLILRFYKCRILLWQRISFICLSEVR